MDRQTLRDWVHRYNADGLTGLADRPRPGRQPRLTEAQRCEVAEWIESRGTRVLAYAMKGAWVLLPAFARPIHADLTTVHLASDLSREHIAEDKCGARWCAGVAPPGG